MKRLICFLVTLAMVLGILAPVGALAAKKGRISSDEELLDALAEMREKNAVGFDLSLKKSYVKALGEEDLAGFEALALQAGMTRYKMQFTEDGDVKVDDVEWTEPNLSSASTEEEFTAALQEIIEGGKGTGQIIVEGQELFEHLTENGRIFLYAAMNGAESVKVSNTVKEPYVIYLEEIVPYSAPWSTVTSAAEWLGTAEAMRAQNEDRFFLVPDEIFAEELAQNDALLQRLETASPEAQWRTYFTEGGISYRYEYNAYLTGQRILNAVAKNDLSSLMKKEKETLAAAEEMAEKCRREDPLETAKEIHNALCETVTYTNDETTDEDDCAIGALLNGQANCDGYADAFCLVGTLCGLEIRYQHGDSREKGEDDKYRDVKHLWNLIKIDGSWRLVDVTWDDRDEKTIYTWFNIGADRARRMHIWDEEMSVPLLAETDPNGRPGREYVIREDSDVLEAAMDAIINEAADFTLVLADDCPIDGKDLPAILGRNLINSFSYSWNEYMRMLDVTVELDLED